MSNKGYCVDSNLLENEKVINNLKETEANRDEYKKLNDYSNFGSALNKYRDFIQSGKVSTLSDLKSIDESDSSETEKEELRKARIGQGKFRKNLIDLWKHCSVSEYKFVEFLIASHIKPWHKSSNGDRLNKYNGLLLLPNYDKLFDKGYISFDDKGLILLSKKLGSESFRKLGITQTDRLVRVYEENKPYLKFHREIYNDILNDK
ncbi:MAG: HNH endonuclease [Bacteroidales bacterium]